MGQTSGDVVLKTPEWSAWVMVMTLSVTMVSVSWLRTPCVTAFSNVKTDQMKETGVLMETP